MATYVLVHGAWHGGWCWQRVTPLLRRQDHEVYTPTLTGLGERAHLGGPHVDLAMHVQDVVNVLEYEDLRDVILVGHSYGGMVITGVADRAVERLASLVYLDAFVPEDGQSMLDLMPPERRAAAEAQRAAGEWRVPSPPLGYFGVTDLADQAWVEPRIVPQPVQTLIQPLQLKRSSGARLPRTFIWCLRHQGAFGRFAERARREPGWRYHELDTWHDAMVIEPRQVADLLHAEA